MHFLLHYAISSKLSFDGSFHFDTHCIPVIIILMCKTGLVAKLIVCTCVFVLI